MERMALQIAEAKEGRKECVLKSNERGFLAQMTAERRETFVTAPRAAKSLFNSSRNIF